LAVPQFEDLRFRRDEIGHSHLQARYAHHRPNAGWQSDAHFSDGTLRLFGLLWALLEGGSMLLLEVPEMSLNDAIVKEIPLIVDRWQRDRKSKRQVVLTTRSDALLSNPGIDERGIVILETGKQGTTGGPWIPAKGKRSRRGSVWPKWCCPKPVRRRFHSWVFGNNTDCHPNSGPTQRRVNLF